MANEAKTAEATATPTATVIVNPVLDVQVDEIPQVEEVYADGDVFTVPEDKIAMSISVAPRDFYHQEKRKDGKDNPLAGQQYWIVTYNGVAFTTMDKTFIGAKAIDDLYSVQLKRTGQYLQLVNFQTMSGKLNADRLLKEIKAINKESKAIELEIKEMNAWSNKKIAMIGALDNSSMGTASINEDLKSRLLQDFNG